MRVSSDEFRALRLEVHELLHDVPLKDVSAVHLPGGGPGRTISDVRAIAAAMNMRAVNGPVRALVALRRVIGRWFGWDAAGHGVDAHRDESFVHRVGPELVRRSTVSVGSYDGGMRVLYVLEREALTEIRNATVHALFALALTEIADGYRLYLAVYVKPISRFTPLYMALIEPFRRFIVYPTVLRSLRERWQERYGSPDRP